MNRTSQKISIIFLSLELVVIIIALYTLIYFANRENDKLVEQYEHKTIDVLSADEMDRFFVIDDDFINFIQNPKYFYSEKLLHSKGWLMLLS